MATKKTAKAKSTAAGKKSAKGRSALSRSASYKPSRTGAPAGGKRSARGRTLLRRSGATAGGKKSPPARAAPSSSGARPAGEPAPPAGGKPVDALLGLEVLEFANAVAWRDWLERHHASSPGVWIKVAKRDSGRASITSTEAVDGALRYGWIDGQGRGLDEREWLLKLTPRRTRSIWSKINRERALALIECGDMRPAGLAEVERARSDGRWDAAYDSSRTSKVPDDLAAALTANAPAQTFFETLNAANRYAILWRLQTAKRPETRARRLAKFVEMLSRREKFHP